MIKLAGLYKSTSKKAGAFLSGKSLDGTKYYVFKNDNKRKDNQPDYILYMVKASNNFINEITKDLAEFLHQQKPEDDLPF